MLSYILLTRFLLPFTVPMRSQYTLRWINKISEIPKLTWNQLALPLATPFLEWDWLENLESSQSATDQTGWQGAHLTLWDQKTLVGAAPMYIKSHSYGEFVFDHQWADLAYRMGVRYYPKLIGMTPFTPVSGYRFLIASSEDEATITQLMVEEIDRFCKKNRLSGCHFLFVDPQWREQMEQYGYRSWVHHSYIWQSRNCQNFDDYLAQFNANQRRNIKRERKSVEQAGLRLKVLEGDDIPESYFAKIYEFYSNTCDKFLWGSKYLSRQFFEQLNRGYAHRVILVVAYQEDSNEPVALSFCIRKNNQLYGRYWGALEEFDALHFEACYYKPLEWALQEGITIFDPGAGGSHKKRRGFPATENYSLHRYYEPKMNKILHNYIEQINQGERAEIEAINQDLPFNKNEITLQALGKETHQE